MSKLFLNPSIKYIPQNDFSVSISDNDGIEATQTFLARKSSLGVGTDLFPFRRGTRADAVDPNVPIIYRFLTIKTAVPSDHAPGIVSVAVTFTGYGGSSGSESSGEEATTPTSSLVGNLEEAPLNENPKWIALDDDSKLALGQLLAGTASAKWDYTKVGDYIKDDEGNETFGALQADGEEIALTGDAITFCKMIAHGRTTYKRPTWTYRYNTESKTGFSSAQLASLGKITTPPGSPADPGAGWAWMLAGPSQEQSGPDRFAKSLDFILVEDNDENQFLYS